MSVTATVVSKVTARETLETNVTLANASNRAVLYDGLDSSTPLSSTTTPAISKIAAFRKAMVAGAATIDLTALTGSNGVAIDGTGLKVQTIMVKAVAGNVAVITIGKGASNGYGMGTAGAAWSIPMHGGDKATLEKNESMPDIAAGAKNIDLAGTGTDAVDIIILMG